jgi:peptide/nickel transport system substrate-binding protein
MRKMLVLIGVITIIILMISGCGTPSAPDVAAPTGPTAIPVMEEAEVSEVAERITIAIAGDIQGIDPHAHELIIWGIVRNNVYEALVTLDPETVEVRPRLATEWEWEDETTLVMTLRDGVVFHNGSEFGADDVKYSIERFVDPATGARRASRLAAVDRVEVVDPLRVKILLDEPDAGLIGALGQVFMVQKDAGESLQVEANGTGPFRLVSWEPNSQVILAKNPGYWVEGQPRVDTLVFRVMPEIVTRVSALIAGDIDIIADVDLKDVARLEEANTKVLRSEVGDYFWVVYFNQTKPYLQDSRVRAALLHALDRETYVEAFQAGLAEVTNSPHPMQHWAYNDYVEGKYPYDLEKAAELLAQAGFPNGEGLALTIIYPSGYPDFRTGSEMWQAALAQLGVEVAIRELELAAWSEQVRGLEHDISWDIKDEGAGDPAILWGGNRAFVPGPDNYNGIDTDTYPELTELLAAAKKTLDQDVRAEIYRQVQKVWVDEVMQGQVATKPVVWALRSNIEGFEPHMSIRYTDFRTVHKGIE